jgi:PPOX class probable F420-dependent enzyme
MDRALAEKLVENARVARLATRTANGRIDLVPITFALLDGRIVTAVDHKPKTTTHLKRLDNIAANPEVSVIVDEYDDERWSELWWVRLHGLAGVIEDNGQREAAVDALVDKYPQYHDRRPSGWVIRIEPIRWQWWSAS